MSVRFSQSVQTAISGLCAVCLAIWSMTGHAQSAVRAASATEGYPKEIAEALLSRRQAEDLAASQTSVMSAFAFVSSNLLWPAGQKLIVAVHGGNFEIWSEIAKIAGQWSTVANVTFDFDLNANKRTVRTWTPNEPTAVAAHVKIRLDIDDAGLRYSAVGREAFLKEFETGSMVLGGIAVSYPMWSSEDRADILHEFGHVLGFLHEQQRPECQNEFRMERGQKGEPSALDLYKEHIGWGHAKTMANLMLAASYKGSSLGKPDRSSLFMYPTQDWLLPGTLHGVEGPCYTKRKNLRLSKIDVARAKADYPFFTDNSITNLSNTNLQALKTIAGNAPNQLSAAPLLVRLNNVERALRPLVYIQVGSSEQRKVGEALRRRLQDGGFIAPGIENVAGKTPLPPRPEVKFFSKRDAEQAQVVAEMVQIELGGAPVQTRLIAKQQERKLPIEVWLQRQN